MVLNRLTKKSPRWYSSFKMSPFFFQMADMLELQKNSGIIRVSLVLFNMINKECFKLSPHACFLNKSLIKPEGSRALPVFRDDNTLLSSDKVQGDV